MYSTEWPRSGLTKASGLFVKRIKSHYTILDLRIRGNNRHTGFSLFTNLFKNIRLVYMYHLYSRFPPPLIEFREIDRRINESTCQRLQRPSLIILMQTRPVAHFVETDRISNLIPSRSSVHAPNKVCVPGLVHHSPLGPGIGL